MADKRKARAKLLHERHEAERAGKLAQIAGQRPTLIAKALEIGEAKRALEAAETGVNLQHMIAELHSYGLSPGDISRTIGYSRRQVLRYLQDWRKRTAA